MAITLIKGIDQKLGFLGTATQSLRKAGKVTKGMLHNPAILFERKKRANLEAKFPKPTK